ncbi:MAG: PEP-CTERM/exosortase system-associated acyltransferase [Thalassotalea sp.]
MTQYSVAENFNQYFKIRLANTKALRQEAYKIRYGVYSAELGWEPENKLQMEMDEYDNYSYHCLLEHRRTGTFAGCIRYIMPSPNAPKSKLPFEASCMHSANKEVFDTDSLPRGSFGEISRLAVLATFRRREKERNKPYVLKEIDPATIYTKEEHRNFPHIAMGLYLGCLALASLCKHQGAVVMMEPRLNRRLKRFGLPFEQIGDVMDYHGQRAMFFIGEKDFYRGLTEQLEALYSIIYKDIVEQIDLVPYGQDTRFNIPNIDLSSHV